jgi:hypothetical protein
MEIISEDLMTETAREVSRFGDDRAYAAMTSLGNIQPDLVAFMVEFTQDLDPEVSALALYWFFNVYRVFQKALRKPLKRVSHEIIVECYEYNEALIESLEDTHDRFVERIASVQLSDQPYVMKYVVESLFGDRDEKDGYELTEDDTGYLFLLLKTVVDALNKTTDE